MRTSLRVTRSKSELKIDLEKISLMMGKNCHMVIYPVNKSRELNLICVVREKKYDPNIYTKGTQGKQKYTVHRSRGGCRPPGPPRKEARL